MVFLHKDDDFVPYTPRRKENLHENLHSLQKEELVENLELTIRKEVRRLFFSYKLQQYLNIVFCFFFLQLHDFAKLNENIFYVYNDIEYLKDEPQKISIMCEEDIHVTEEVYKRPMFTMPAYRLFTLFFYWSIYMWPSAVDYAVQVINIACRLCNCWLPHFFSRK